MKIPRQEERRSRFQHAFGLMPLWETWATEHTVVLTVDRAGSPVDTMEETRNHCKSIPRRVRRDMARKRSLREFRVDHNLPEPKGIGVE